MYKFTRITACSDVGADRKMTLRALFELMSDCERFQVEGDKYLMDFMTANNYAMYLCARQADILRLPVFWETVTAVTSIYELHGFTGCRNTFVYGANGEVLAQSYATGILADLTTNKLAKASDKFIKGYNCDKKLDMEYLPRRIDLRGEPMKAMPLTVPKDFIDIYGHVNNVHYITAAAEHLPENAVIKRVRVEYKNAAKYGDTMDAYLYATDGKHTVELKNDNLTYAVVEFTLK